MAWLRRTVGGADVIFSDRTGGVSSGRYATANTAGAVGDLPERVTENRRRVGQALGGTAADLGTWVRARAVHGTNVRAVDRLSHDAFAADAVLTNDPEVTLAYRTADCAPLVLSAGQTVLLAHIGWRGLAGGLVQGAIEALTVAEPGQHIAALLGPTIGPCCYDRPPEDAALIAARAGVEFTSPQRHGSVAIDIPGAVESLLDMAGIDVVVEPVCTSCSPEYFSVRRDGPRSGNQCVVVRLRA